MIQVYDGYIHDQRSHRHRWSFRWPIGGQRPYRWPLWFRMSRFDSAWRNCL